MQIDPISSVKPSNADLARGINQIHACFEDHKAITQRGVASATKAAAVAAEKAAKASADIVSIREALGLTEGQKKVAGLSTPFKAFLRTAGASASALVAVIFFLRLSVALWPGVWSFVQTIWHVLMTGKF